MVSRHSRQWPDDGGAGLWPCERLGKCHAWIVSGHVWLVSKSKRFNLNFRIWTLSGHVWMVSRHYLGDSGAYAVINSGGIRRVHFMFSMSWGALAPIGHILGSRGALASYHIHPGGVECQAFSHLRDDTVQTLPALADGSARFAADENVCTVYTFISGCMKIVEMKWCLLLRHHRLRSSDYRLGPVSDPGRVM
jgi:hypothetical protein